MFYHPATSQLTTQGDFGGQLRGNNARSLSEVEPGLAGDSVLAPRLLTEAEGEGASAEREFSWRHLSVEGATFVVVVARSTGGGDSDDPAQSRQQASSDSRDGFLNQREMHWLNRS